MHSMCLHCLQQRPNCTGITVQIGPCCPECFAVEFGSHRYEEPPHLGERQRDAGVGLGGRGERGHLDVELQLQVAELGVAGQAQLLLL